jgi:hypothetical protein
MVRPRFEALKTGFIDLIPVAALGAVTPQELGRLVSGEIDMDVDDMKKHVDVILKSEWDDETDTQVFTKDTIQQMGYMWECFRKMDTTTKRHLVRALTGYDRLPVGGWGHIGVGSRITVWFGDRSNINWTEFRQYSFDILSFKSEAEMQKAIVDYLETVMLYRE